VEERERLLILSGKRNKTRNGDEDESFVRTNAKFNSRPK
jgi:hypothetical protein